MGSADSMIKNPSKGIFITFEGPDGSGKTTQIKKLAQYCRQQGREVILTREPGGTPISEKIRNIILDPENSEMCAEAEALLYAASRAQHVSQLIIPSLEAGMIVLCDRFVDSSIAYQGYARGLGDGVRVINEFATMGIKPDLTFFLDVDPETGHGRNVVSGKADRLELEALDFHRKVYEGYRLAAEAEPERFVRIDASEPVEAVFAAVRSVFDEYVSEAAE